MPPVNGPPITELTLRDLFAAAALIGILSRGTEENKEAMAGELAYMYARLMLLERYKYEQR